MCVVCVPPTSFPYIMRWWVVMRALKTTTQLELAVRSNSVSANWGMFTFISLVQWMRSGSEREEREGEGGETNQTGRFLQGEFTAVTIQPPNGWMTTSETGPHGC